MRRRDDRKIVYLPDLITWAWKYAETEFKGQQECTRGRMEVASSLVGESEGHRRPRGYTGQITAWISHLNAVKMFPDLKFIEQYPVS